MVNSLYAAQHRRHNTLRPIENCEFRNFHRVKKKNKNRTSAVSRPSNAGARAVKTFLRTAELLLSSREQRSNFGIHCAITLAAHGIAYILYGQVKRRGGNRGVKQ